jgi:hypothetical protein
MDVHNRTETVAVRILGISEEKKPAELFKTSFQNSGNHQIHPLKFLNEKLGISTEKSQLGFSNFGSKLRKPSNTPSDKTFELCAICK